MMAEKSDVASPAGAEAVRQNHGASGSATLTEALFIQIRRKRYPVASLKQASEMFCAARDKSGLGASQTPDAFIVNSLGEKVARISYNGRVWPVEEWTQDQRPLYDNRRAA